MVAMSTDVSTLLRQPAMAGAQNSPKRPRGMSQRAPPLSGSLPPVGVARLVVTHSRVMSGAAGVVAQMVASLLQSTFTPMVGKFLVKGPMRLSIDTGSICEVLR